ncbi:Myb-like_DNA-binding domain-containing protein [Hexamita inflata]|uniref:Myb-like DNA-binding domain-containing protein n=1 Tax=Hexamita inflata TaxID=28002 RepID=A0AA86Q0D5_9EUKA|nr:Myb-like DNA-binding domain-containing protein [Hexamita inflata]
MMKREREQYTPWSDEDIRKLLAVTEIYLNNKINWQKVVEHFPNRTVLQCKSFYNNKMRKYVFDCQDGVPIPNLDLVQYCYVYYITRYKNDSESLDMKCKRIMAEACYEDIFPTMMLVMKNELNYKYNKKLLVGTREFLIYHFLQVDTFNNLFQAVDSIKIQGINVSKQQWATFCEYIETFKPQQFLNKIDEFLAKIL